MNSVVVTVMAYAHAVIGVMSEVGALLDRLNVVGLQIVSGAANLAGVVVTLKNRLFPFEVFGGSPVLIDTARFPFRLPNTFSAAVCAVVGPAVAPIDHVGFDPLKYLPAFVAFTLHAVVVFAALFAAVVVVLNVRRGPLHYLSAVQAFYLDLFGLRFCAARTRAKLTLSVLRPAFRVGLLDRLATVLAIFQFGHNRLQIREGSATTCYDEIVPNWRGL